jgi:hypothetical protein
MVRLMATGEFQLRDPLMNCEPRFSNRVAGISGLAPTYTGSPHK